MLQRDYMMRLIKAVTEAIARIAGLAKAGRVNDAEREVALTLQRDLGISRSDALRLAPASLVMVIGKERAGLAADLLAAEADALDAAGRAEDAATRRAHARAIRAAAI